MNMISALGGGLIFALACNLDTVLAAVGQGAGGKRMGWWETLAVAAVTTVVTYLSLRLGAAGAELLPQQAAEKLGGLSLVGLGLWYILDGVRGKVTDTEGEKKGWLPLSGALAVNNAGVGVAAGVTGLPPGLAAGCNFVVTGAALLLGRSLGRRLKGWSGLALPVSGGLLVALGLWKLR